MTRACWLLLLVAALSIPSTAVAARFQETFVADRASPRLGGGEEGAVPTEESSAQAVSLQASSVELIAAAQAATLSSDVAADGAPAAPAGYHYELRRRKPFLISGLTLFGVTYVPSVVIGVLAATGAMGSRSTGLALNVIPIVGPLAAMAAVPPAGSEVALILMVVAGQTLGAVFTILGLIPRQVLVENSEASLGDTRGPVASIMVAPVGPRGTAGLTLAAQF